jgi:hypothetical protein
MLALKPHSNQTHQVPVTRAQHTELDRLVKFVQENKDRPLTEDFGKFEVELRDRLAAVGREVVHDELVKADVDATRVKIGEEEYRRTGRASQSYMTAFGNVHVERALFRAIHDPVERVVAALEPRIGIIGGFWTPAAAKQGAWVVAQMTPGMAEELFQRVGSMRPSKASLDRLPKELSAEWEQERQSMEAQLRKQLVVPEQATSVAMSLDGVLVPMKDASVEGVAVEKARDERIAKNGSRAGGPAGYREVGCATVSFYDEAGEMLSAIRMARMPQEKKVDLKAMLAAEMAVVYAQRPDLKVLKIADGCRDNWTFLSRFRVGTEAIDYYHACEHLHKALETAFPKATNDRRRRFAELSDILLTESDGVERVLGALQDLEAQFPKRSDIAREVAYFRRNKRRMRYSALRAAGLPVGSGPVEAACKTLASQRLKQSGMRWGMEGGQAILTMRAWSQSDRFDSAWALLASKYRLSVSNITNVVSLESYRTRASSESE